MLFAPLLLIIGLFLRTGVILHKTVCRCSELRKEELTVTSQRSTESKSNPTGVRIRFLSYQPPGNGWNNQRIALENAFVLAKLLNRTLLVHPLAPHVLGSRLKAGQPYGYLAYNMLNSSDLLPPSQFLDLELMSQVVSVKEITVSHPEFVADYSSLTWRNICHTPGYGFWVDQLPQTAFEVELLARQRFSSLGRVWRGKCAEERERVKKNHVNIPLVRYVADLQNDPSEMLYFEHGTLFGIHIRFTTMENALQAQKWVVNHIRYNQAVWESVAMIERKIGSHFNAIQVRRKDHMDRKLPQSYWIERMIQKNFSKEFPVYVATNDANSEWFNSFLTQGYKLYFSKDFKEYLSFPNVRESLRNDLLGIHEQCLCEHAGLFVGSPASTFNAFILRHRGEVQMKDGLIMDTLHTYWIGHQSY